MCGCPECNLMMSTKGAKGSGNRKYANTLQRRETMTRLIVALTLAPIPSQIGLIVALPGRQLEGLSARSRLAAREISVKNNSIRKDSPFLTFAPDVGSHPS
jgi:hypothetical protein